MDALNREDAKEALQKPVQEEHARFTEAALDKIIDMTKGYPYFLQEWGYHAWNIATHSTIDVDVVDQATDIALQRLDESFSCSF